MSTLLSAIADYSPLLPWVLGQSEPPAALAGLIAGIGAFARARLGRG